MTFISCSIMLIMPLPWRIPCSKNNTGVPLFLTTAVPFSLNPSLVTYTNIINQMFSRKSQVCCEDGQVLPGSPDAQCCGNKTFDPSSHTCCHGYVSPGGGLSCCGQIAYSRTNASCCAGKR